ncbi:MAG: GNAT family N-acetyltransferase [Ferrovibrio sp.]|uniref:GNAT family N-acetyltransferase n=1 Tax=Ferrovibrio sp. TaxID=1917215 RepID=UPI002602462C|nr:GNAT family N-acetyltransferase [Ferrovibrio sp.]MCW0235397.1 GNAT family N-acetyltransferase [Ferrovibrio sp.]
MLTLKPLYTPYLESLSANPAAVLAEHPNHAEIAELATEVATATLDLYAQTGATEPWLSYFALRDADNALLGICSFKSPPVQGLVEIAYFTFPGYEAQGVASVMARELLKIAFNEYEIQAVLAHTLPEESASTAILRKRGFTLIEALDDPDDGTIWRWALARP